MDEGSCCSLITNHWSLFLVQRMRFCHWLLLGCSTGQSWSQYTCTTLSTGGPRLWRMLTDCQDCRWKKNQVKRVIPKPPVCIWEIQALPITSEQLEVATRNDAYLSKVMQYAWIASYPEVSLKPFFIKHHELTVEANRLLWGMQFIIPSSFQSQVLQDVHSEYGGMTRMKSVAHGQWPKLDSEIEAVVKSCTTCQSVNVALAVTPLHSWIWHAKPWHLIHIDYVGPFS